VSDKVTLEFLRSRPQAANFFSLYLAVRSPLSLAKSVWFVGLNRPYFFKKRYKILSKPGMPSRKKEVLLAF
jgi:hypothetical protein